MTTHAVAAETADPLRPPRSRATLAPAPSPPPADRALRRGLLRIEEAAEWLGLSRRKTYELVSRGELPSVCIGRSRRIALAALESFVERLPSEPVHG